MIGIASSMNIECEYGNTTWTPIGEVYYCAIEYILNIFSLEDAAISSVTGLHHSTKTNEDVTAFYANNKSIEYFPRGFGKIFPNLKAIIVYNGRIKEIHQADFKSCPKLTFLDLYQNDIEVLEEDLFEYNRNLIYIRLDYNKITQIHENVFNHLPKLMTLILDKNKCIDMHAKNNSTAIRELKRQIKIKCPMPHSVSTACHNYIAPMHSPGTDCHENFVKCQAQINEFSSHLNSFETKVMQKFDQSLRNEIHTSGNHEDKSFTCYKSDEGMKTLKNIEKVEKNLMEIEAKIDAKIKKMEQSLLEKMQVNHEYLERKLTKVLKALHVE